MACCVHSYSFNIFEAVIGVVAWVSWQAPVSLFVGTLHHTRVSCLLCSTTYPASSLRAKAARSLQTAVAVPPRRSPSAATPRASSLAAQHWRPQGRVHTPLDRALASRRHPTMRRRPVFASALHSASTPKPTASRVLRYADVPADGLAFLLQCPVASRPRWKSLPRLVVDSAVCFRAVLCAGHLWALSDALQVPSILHRACRKG